MPIARVTAKSRCKRCNHTFREHQSIIREGGHYTDFGTCSCPNFLSKADKDG